MSEALDGVLVVDKPDGMTSHDVVATVRRRLPRGTKVGHTGTLDPFATGVLPVVLGRATRLAQFLTASRKAYVADIAFGTATDTGDRCGTVIATADDAARDALEAATIREALAAFVGTHPQRPPDHSAKKVEGERAYVLARRGAAVDLPAVDVTAYEIELTGWDPARHLAVVRMETAAGFYVRSLARDLGQRLGVPAHLSALRRTASGPFTEADAHALADVAGATPEALLAWRVPLSGLLPQFPALSLDAAQLRAVRHGQPFAARASQSGPAGAEADARVRLLDEAGDLVALARPAAGAPHLLHADIVVG